MWTCRAASRAEINSRYFTMSPSHRRSRVAWLALAVPACSASFVTPPALHECRTRTRTICMDASEAPLLDVVGLKASVVGTQILKGVTLKVNRGEVHAIMGPNGSGKSTFSKVLVGHPAYEVDGGTAQYRGEDILEDAPESRAQDGIFLAFQYPVEIPGVSNNDFLRMAVNKRRGAQDLEEYDPIEFMGVLAEKMDVVGMKMDFMSRDVNRCVLPPASRSTLRSLRRSPRDARRHRAAARVHACGVEIEMKSRFRSGRALLYRSQLARVLSVVPRSGFSGGEKKRNEILQMALLEPELAILDETDSGLDIDALKTVAQGVNTCAHAPRPRPRRVPPSTRAAAQARGSDVCARNTLVVRSLLAAVRPPTQLPHGSERHRVDYPLPAAA